MGVSLEVLQMKETTTYTFKIGNITLGTILFGRLAA